MIAPAGEYYVLSMLHLAGLLAAPAPRNAPVADILVVDPLANSVVASVQVKTRTYGADGGWHMSKKHETLISERLFYAFVDFEPKPPKVYVIPSAVVAKACAENHKAWLKLAGKKGPHNDHDMRRILPDFSRHGVTLPEFAPGWMNQFENKWEQLLAVSQPEGPAPGAAKLVTRSTTPRQ